MMQLKEQTLTMNDDGTYRLKYVFQDEKEELTTIEIPRIANLQFRDIGVEYRANKFEFEFPILEGFDLLVE